MQINRITLVFGLVAIAGAQPALTTSAQRVAPQELRWDAKLRPRVDAALSVVADDPVNGIYALEDIIGTDERPRLNCRDSSASSFECSSKPGCSTTTRTFTRTTKNMPPPSPSTLSSV